MPIIYAIDADGNEIALRANAEGQLLTSGGGGGGGGITQAEVEAAIAAAVPISVSGPLTDTQLRATPVAVTQYSTVTIGSVSTSGTGDLFVDLPAGDCVAVDLINLSGTTIEYRRGGAGSSIQVPTGSARLILGLTNSSQVSIRRVDQANDSVSLGFERLS